MEDNSLAQIDKDVDYMVSLMIMGLNMGMPEGAIAYKSKVIKLALSQLNADAIIQIEKSKTGQMKAVKNVLSNAKILINEYTANSHENESIQKQ